MTDLFYEKEEAYSGDAFDEDTKLNHSTTTTCDCKGGGIYMVSR